MVWYDEGEGLGPEARRGLGRTDLMVSPICLGTMTWGEQNSERDAHAQLDYALERGVNFIDTAELYPVPPRPETQGRTEAFIGSWLAADRSRRGRVIIATKVAGRSSRIDWLRKDGALAALSPAQIREAVEASLARLRTDVIDLYQVHWPDRPMRLFGGLGYEPFPGEGHAIEETLEVMAELVREGKVRHVGVSNETPWGLMQYLDAAERTGAPRIASIQNAYSLVNRTFELGLSEFTHREDVSLLAYSPLAHGFLSGKYEGGARPAGSRLALFPDFPSRYLTPGAPKAISAYVQIARDAGLDPAQMAIAFVASRPFVTSTIIGATTLDQLRRDIDASALVLEPAIVEKIEAVHLANANPCP